LKNLIYRAAINKTTVNDLLKSFEQFFMDAISHPTVTKIIRHATQQHVNRITFPGPQDLEGKNTSSQRKCYCSNSVGVNYLETRTFQLSYIKKATQRNSY